MLKFCLHSLFREYGRLFIGQIAMPHPIRTARAWLLADRGIKNEQTEVNDPIQKTIDKLLGNAAQKISPETRFEMHGNVFYSRVFPNK